MWLSDKFSAGYWNIAVTAKTYKIHTHTHSSKINTIHWEIFFLPRCVWYTKFSEPGRNYEMIFFSGRGRKAATAQTNIEQLQYKACGQSLQPLPCYGLPQLELSNRLIFCAKISAYRTLKPAFSSEHLANTPQIRSCGYNCYALTYWLVGNRFFSLSA